MTSGSESPDAENEEPVPCGIQGFEPCAATIHGWIEQADRDGGRRAGGLTGEEREELRRLRRENRQLRQEKNILAKAAAWFAQGDVTSSRSSSS